MPTNRKSAAGSKPLRAKHSALGRRLAAAAREAAAYLRGEITLIDFLIRRGKRGQKPFDRKSRRCVVGTTLKGMMRNDNVRVAKISKL